MNRVTRTRTESTRALCDKLSAALAGARVRAQSFESRTDGMLEARALRQIERLLNPGATLAGQHRPGVDAKWRLAQLDGHVRYEETT